MPLFRFHTGSLMVSLETTTIVKNIGQLYDRILWKLAASKLPFIHPFTIKIEPYPDEENNFDPRIGWYTHIVMADTHESGKFTPIGFLSEPFEGKI